MLKYYPPANFENKPHVLQRKNISICKFLDENFSLQIKFYEIYN